MQDGKPNKINTRLPITQQSGQEFNQLDDILDHLQGESSGYYLIGRNNLWHGGIHISHATTPWCALSGTNVQEQVDFPAGYKGE